VTPDGLLSCLELPNLVHFYFSTKDPVPKSFIVQLASQSPSLEEISVNLSCEKNGNQLLLPLKAILEEISHPRLMKLINLTEKRTGRSLLLETDSESDPDDEVDEREEFRAPRIFGLDVNFSDLESDDDDDDDDHEENVHEEIPPWRRFFQP